jgi:hypothetical protein
VSATNLFDDVHREVPDDVTADNGESISALIGRTGWVSVEGGF